MDLREHYFQRHDAAILRLPDLAVRLPDGRMVHDYGILAAHRADTAPISGREAEELFAGPPDLERCFCLGSVDPYYHFLLDVAPPLILAAGWKLPFEQVLLTSAPPHMEELTRLLKARFGWAPRYLERADQGLLAVRDGLFHRQNRLPVGERKRLLELILPAPREPGDPGRALFLGRGDAATRRCLNEAELIAALKRCGVEPVTLSGMTIQAQAMLLRSAPLIVAVHGAALANLVFARPGTPAIEIAPPGVYSFFKDIADALGLPHQVVPGRITGPNPKDLPDRHRDFTVDPETVARAVAATKVIKGSLD